MRRYRLRTCVNPRCGEEIAPYARLRLCPSCAFALRFGMGAGGALLVGGLAALYRVAIWMHGHGWIF